jgi:hypothetical protein
MLSTLSQYNSDGKHISFSMFYFVDSLLCRPRSIRWSDIVLRHFCHALDNCCVVFSRTRFFLFVLNLYIIFFERIHATWLEVPLFFDRTMFDVHIHMWGKLFPNRGYYEFPITLVGREVHFDLFPSEHNPVLNIL